LSSSLSCTIFARKRQTHELEMERITWGNDRRT
jgi:hypothetical protein